jgi:hypothetical protein
MGSEMCGESGGVGSGGTLGKSLAMGFTMMEEPNPCYVTVLIQEV